MISFFFITCCGKVKLYSSSFAHFTGEKIRFRVVAEQFTDTTPAGPNLVEGENTVADRKEGKIPYIIYVSTIVYA